MIYVQGLIKTYKTGWLWWRTSIPVLKGFDFIARPGEVTGVLGPNGAGKTTLFRIICGLEKFKSGEVLVNGINPLSNPNSLRGQIALLPEEAGVSNETSGWKHLWIFGAMMGLSENEIFNKMQECDEILGLNSFWRRSFVTYSRGQKARIALARMNMMPNASVFIFDEPSNGLDFEAVSRLHLFIRHLANEGKTVLVASHILSDLRHLCDRLVGIDGGVSASQQRMDSWLEDHSKTQAPSMNKPVPESSGNSSL